MHFKKCWVALAACSKAIWNWWPRSPARCSFGLHLHWNLCHNVGKKLGLQLVSRKWGNPISVHESYMTWKRSVSPVPCFKQTNRNSHPLWNSLHYQVCEANHAETKVLVIFMTRTQPAALQKRRLGRNWDKGTKSVGEVKRISTSICWQH